MSEAPKIHNVQYDTSAPIMDLEQIEMLLMADDDGAADSLASELFVLYTTEASERLSQLDKICSERDAVALRKLVHFIAGGAGNLGLMRLDAFYRGIERALVEGVLEDFEACSRLIPQEFEISRKAFMEGMGLEQ